MLERFFVPPGGSYFLFGPRGTGKTTLLRATYPSALLVNLLDPATYRALAARPERLRELVAVRPAGSEVVIDEVQRVPELLNVVHDLIEAAPPRRFVLTGSSARKLRRGGVDLLGGRAALRTLHPFMAGEWPRFTLTDDLEFGLVPLIVDSDDPGETLAAYAALYLEQEVQAEGLARDIGQFSRFLEAVSFSHASVLNVSAVARDAEVSRKTTEGFLSILEDLLLAFRVPVFTRRAKRATARHPKLYLFDAGVFRSLRPSGPLDRPEEIDGAALEGLVAQHLRAWLAYGGGDAELFTWRTRSRVEVDFVVYGSECFWAVEVKNVSRLRPADFRGLRTFHEEYPQARRLLLYRGRDALERDGVECRPVGDVLAAMKPGRDLL